MDSLFALSWVEKDMQRTDAAARRKRSTATFVVKPAHRDVAAPAVHAASKPASSGTRHSTTKQGRDQGRSARAGKEGAPDGTVRSDTHDRVEARPDQRERSRDGKEEDSKAGADETSAAKNGTLDTDALAEDIIPLAADDGIFELLMPDGSVLGVVVNIQPSQVNFILSPPDGKLGQLLQNQKMELKSKLERRMERNVNLTVLPSTG